MGELERVRAVQRIGRFVLDFGAEDKQLEGWVVHFKFSVDGELGYGDSWALSLRTASWGNGACRQLIQAKGLGSRMLLIRVHGQRLSSSCSQGRLMRTLTGHRLHAVGGGVRNRHSTFRLLLMLMSKEDWGRACVCDAVLHKRLRAPSAAACYHNCPFSMMGV